MTTPTLVKPGFEPVPDEPPAAGKPPGEQSIAIAMITLGLKALSQRFVTALADLFCLFALLLGWHLWLQVPQPDTHQLIWLGLYAAFALAACVIVRRR
jgi:hypothetical protein